VIQRDIIAASLIEKFHAFVVILVLPSLEEHENSRAQFCVVCSPGTVLLLDVPAFEACELLRVLQERCTDLFEHLLVQCHDVISGTEHCELCCKCIDHFRLVLELLLRRHLLRLRRRRRPRERPNDDSRD
jgi:hypothetical protein